MQENVEHLYASLRSIYKRSFLPLEDHYSFSDFFSASMSDTDIEAKPFVLLVGQYSVGKTTFINHLLGNPSNGYPGSNVGPEPTTDRFMAIMHGKENRVIPGNAVAVSPGKPFRGLQTFGNSFLQKFQCAETNAEILESMTLIDTPGVLSGEKQRIGRNYDMAEVCRWFADRSDLILILFDAHKLDISDELKIVIESLSGNDDKIRIVLNKADQVNPQQLMRVYGALMWSLGKVFRTPEVTRVYISTFWDKPFAEAGRDSAALFEREKADLFRDLRDIPKNAAIRRVNELVKRARTAKVHALVCACLRKMMPAMFGKEKRQKELLRNLEVIFQAVAQEHGISPGDFPKADVYRERLVRWTGTGRTLANLPKLNRELIKKLDDCLAYEVPSLLRPLAVDQDHLKFLEKSHTYASSPAFQQPAAGGGDDDEATIIAMVKAAIGDQDVEHAATSLGSHGGYPSAPVAQPSHSDAPMQEAAPPRSAPPAPPIRNPPPLPQKSNRVRVLHAYKASSDGELTINKGDEIVVLEEDQTGWWKGLLHGQEGWFPYNYVEKI